MNTPWMLRGVDLAAFAAALVVRLRGVGVLVSANGQATFVQALRLLVPGTTPALYWAARLTLVNRMEDLSAFDAVFTSVFGPVDTTSPDGATGPAPVLP
ncbi:MAG TPA: VWA containing CoxE family protein, partial [Mycobacterium sp.]|nr:VWA containing CoxE family protein [Mycobacterium sp.]